MAASDDFKQAINAGNIRDALKRALSEAVELEIITWVNSAEPQNSEHPQVGSRMRTHISLVESKITNEIGSQFVDGPYAELREFHLNQIKESHQIIHQNLQTLQQLFQLWQELQPQDSSASSTLTPSEIPATAPKLPDLAMPSSAAVEDTDVFPIADAQLDTFEGFVPHTVDDTNLLADLRAESSASEANQTPPTPEVAATTAPTTETTTSLPPLADTTPLEISQPAAGAEEVPTALSHQELLAALDTGSSAPSLEPADPLAVPPKLTADLRQDELLAALNTGSSGSVPEASDLPATLDPSATDNADTSTTPIADFDLNLLAPEELGAAAGLGAIAASGDDEATLFPVSDTQELTQEEPAPASEATAGIDESMADFDISMLSFDEPDPSLTNQEAIALSGEEESDPLADFDDDIFGLEASATPAEAVGTPGEPDPLAGFDETVFTQEPTAPTEASATSEIDESMADFDMSMLSPEATPTEAVDPLAGFDDDIFGLEAPAAPAEAIATPEELDPLAAFDLEIFEAEETAASGTRASEAVDPLAAFDDEIFSMEEVIQAPAIESTTPTDDQTVDPLAALDITDESTPEAAQFSPSTSEIFPSANEEVDPLAAFDLDMFEPEPSQPSSMAFEELEVGEVDPSDPLAALFAEIPLEEPSQLETPEGTGDSEFDSLAALFAETPEDKEAAARNAELQETDPLAAFDADPFADYPPDLPEPSPTTEPKPKFAPPPPPPPHQQGNQNP